MALCFITKERPRTESNYEYAKNLRYLGEERHHSPQSSEYFLDFIKHQRTSFFSKVEDDYFDDDEEVETIHVYSSSDKEAEPSYQGVQERLHEPKLIPKTDLKSPQEYSDQLEDKYNHIESLICDSSLLFSEDLKFLFEDELNYLHLLIRTKGIEVVNSRLKKSERREKKEKDQNDLIEIG